MLVKVRLPTPLLPPKMPQLPHLPHIPQLPAHMRVSITDVNSTLSALPSSTTILASIVALFVLLSFVRALTIGLREHLAFVRGRKEARFCVGAAAQSAGGASGGEKRAQGQEQRPVSSWLWGLVQFFPPSRLSSPAPVFNEKSSPSSSSSPSSWSQQQMQQQHPRVNAHTASRRPGGPVYDRPLATLYERDVPVSMAKMIMSRHTFRRPTSRPPPARPATVQIQVQRRVVSPPPLPPSVPSAPQPSAPSTSTSSVSSTQVIPPSVSANTPPPPPPPPPPAPSAVSSAPPPPASSPSTFSSAPTPSTFSSPPRPNSTPRPPVLIPAPRIPNLKAPSPLVRPVSPPSPVRSPSPGSEVEREVV